MRALAGTAILATLLGCVQAEGQGRESQSTCFGTAANGRLIDAVRLPGAGENFRSYSVLANLLGRTYVHSRVRQAVVAAYAELALTSPDVVFVYGETGLAAGGQFKPHKTHRNGTSVDFMVPVRDARSASIPLPTHALNKYGYSLEFDRHGRLGKFRIDFEAMAEHLDALDRAARHAGISIRRVIFDPQLQPALVATGAGRALARRLRFSSKRSWVRHDEHYHVDFSVPCRALSEWPGD
ncbi:MAG: penicillin-insensitive murein endopeptidase [Gammaproteobacteria bacterium]